MSQNELELKANVKKVSESSEFQDRIWKTVKTLNYEYRVEALQLRRLDLYALIEASAVLKAFG